MMMMMIIKTVGFFLIGLQVTVVFTIDLILGF